MILTYTKRPARAYALAILALGLAALTLALPAYAPVLWDARYLLLAFCALTAGTRLYLKVPYAGNAVPLSTAFVLLTMLLYGYGAAVPLAAAAAVVSSLRLSRRGGSLLYDSAPAAAVTLLAGWGAQTFGVRLPGASAYAAALAALLFCLLQSAAESAQLTAYGRTGVGRSAPRVYLDALAWTFTSYLLPTSFAVLAAQLPAGRALDALVAVAAAFAAADALYQAHRGGSTSAHARPAERGREQFAGTPAFNAAFEHAAIGMAVLSAKGSLLWVNRSLCSFLGYAESELMSSSLKAVTHEDDLMTALAGLKSMLRRRSDFLQMEVRHQRRGGEQVWALWNVARFQGARDAETYLILQLQDITERKQSEEQLRHDAFHDPLTGLPNRALFADHVKLTIARAKRIASRRFAVLFCDLDRFKVINDSLGHVAGDQLLVEVARRLENCLRQGDTVARVGGDEFTILLDDLVGETETEAVAVAERIQKEVSAAIVLSGREVFTTMSIGVAAGATNYSDPEDILRDADTAMYRAKSLGKARHVVFDHSMHASAVNLLQIETDLRKALERDQFHLLYQPIVSLDDFKLCGFEALVRWQHPERGLISPLDFIPIAEETGPIIQLGEWALHEACRQMREWQEKYPQASPFFMSVNLSAKQFNHTLLIAQVDNALRRTGLNPRQLKLEITEGAVMENIDTAAEMLRHLRDLGVQLAIDDFGTGYSSLSYLHRFPIDTLKIDRSFVTRMANNTENVEIVRTIVMLAQVLGMDVVAEGVETREQLKLLRDLKCEYGQGYYFSRPSSPADAEKIIVETNEKVRKVDLPGEAPPPPVADTSVKAIKLVPPA
jgi:diguanylate cyclase (GGDEF)-like protein/PAS domain S-box-containing protein